jgi:hypothetical protein
MFVESRTGVVLINGSGKHIKHETNFVSRYMRFSLNSALS